MKRETRVSHRHTSVAALRKFAGLGVASVVVLCSLGHANRAAAGDGNTGRPATQAEVSARSITVFPDGTGLPPGRGSVTQGRVVYATQCASCHGAKGEGVGEFPALVGGKGTLATATPVQTVGSFWASATTLFDYTRRAMPYAAPGTLSNDEVYAVVAYVLRMNDIVDEDTALDAKTLPAVKMPNVDGFVTDPRPASTY